MFYKTDTQLDHENIWHPYSYTKPQTPVYHVDHAEGCTLFLKDGTKLIDGMASWWCAIHGYNHPTLNLALHKQVEKMAHVMFGGLTHDPAITLARKLIDITPAPLQTVFFADSGSIAVEVAIKMAMQYWQARGQSKRKKLITIKGGYHGDTLATMSLCDPETGMHTLFSGLLQEHIFIEKPPCRFHDDWNEYAITPLKEAIQTHKDEVIGVILEPILQGAGGMYFYAPNYLKRVSEFCKENNILLIADEIATGFGRTGKLFACDYANVCPDIICLGKALTGGYMTLAATLCNAHISDTISDKGPFMHGPTFMANPTACSVANASIDILQENRWPQQVNHIEHIMSEHLHRCSEFETVKEVRVLGAVGVVEMKKPVEMEIIQPLFVKEGIWVRPFGSLIYIMPPYTISDKELLMLCNGIYRVIAQH